jgi:hypothetical protein
MNDRRDLLAYLKAYRDGCHWYLETKSNANNTYRSLSALSCPTVTNIHTIGDIDLAVLSE